MTIKPGTPVEWKDDSGSTRYGVVQGFAGLGYSVLIPGERRHLVAVEKVVVSLDDD